MTFKKIFAGVLAAASVLSVSATAFAADTVPTAPDKNKNITKPGETEYETEIGTMGATLDVELPASLKAFLNPYGAEVAVGPAAGDTMKTGVVSWGYEVINHTEDFGIFIDAKDVKGTASSGIDFVKATPAAGKKEVYMNLVYAKDVATFKVLTPANSNAKSSDQKGTGVVVVDKTAATQAKFGYVKGATAADSPDKGVIGFVGEISKQGSGTTTITDWTEDDTVTVSFVLKIAPAPKAATATDFT